MNDAQIFEQDEALEPETDLVDVLIVLAKRKKFIAGFTLGAAVLSAAISLAIPNEFKATAKLLPPQQNQSGAMALLSQLGGVASMAAGAAGLKNPSDMYVGMLQSRTLADRLIERFDLKKVYDEELLEKARKELISNTKITSEKNGLITIDVEDRDPKRSAQLANAYIDELQRLTKVLAVSEASQRRLFFERELETAKNNLAKAEMALKAGMDTRGVISVDVESRAVMETVARLKAMVSAKEIERSSMRAFVTDTNPDYRKVEQELASLRAELSKLENGRGDANTSANAPQGQNASGLDNIKLLRDLKYNQMLYEMLAKQYEVARLDEAKDPSIIQVLDQAIVPERKEKPRRSLIVLAGAILGLLTSMAFVYFTGSKKRNPDEQETQWRELKSHLRFK